MPTGSFLLGYVYDGTYIGLGRNDKKTVDDYMIGELVKAFPKELRNSFLSFGIPFEFLESRHIDNEIAAKLSYIDFSVVDINFDPQTETVVATPIVNANAHYQPISTLEHRVTYIAPLLVKDNAHGTFRAVELEEHTLHVKAIVVARLTWGIRLPAGEFDSIVPANLPKGLPYN